MSITIPPLLRYFKSLRRLNLILASFLIMYETVNAAELFPVEQLKVEPFDLLPLEVIVPTTIPPIPSTVSAIPTLDLAFLAAAATVGIYLATARLTLIGWLFQYRATLKDKTFLKVQIRVLTALLVLAFLAGGLALKVIGLRTEASNQVEEFETYQYILWISIIILLGVFHLGIFIYRMYTKSRRAKQEPLPPIDRLVVIAGQLETAGSACATAVKDMVELSKLIQVPANVPPKTPPPAPVPDKGTQAEDAK